jgi:hypothetical protein
VIASKSRSTFGEGPRIAPNERCSGSEDATAAASEPRTKVRRLSMNLPEVVVAGA